MATSSIFYRMSSLTTLEDSAMECSRLQMPLTFTRHRSGFAGTPASDGFARMLKRRHEDLTIWETPSGRSRRWVRRKDVSVPVPLYARLAIVALLVTLAATLTWHRLRLEFDRTGDSGSASKAAATSLIPAPATALWQSDALASLESGAREAQAGNITAAEVAVDRAASIIEVARVESRSTSSDFFDIANGSLDRVLQPHPENSRLFEHVTAARVDLAQLRSALSAPTVAPPNSPATPTQISVPTAADDSRGAQRAVGKSPAMGDEVVIASPREAASNHILDPSVLGADTIDATLMPETLEILLPPSTRLFVDNVRVQNLTIKGASQTLDGIHWKNVTFVQTRLRYESGELDLQNVHFLRCTFGLPADRRGARLATAIALGQSSITIE